VIDQWSRESLSVEPGFTLTGTSVAAALDTVAQRRPLPKAITVNHGTEFTSRALDDWAVSTSTSFGPASLCRTGYASRLTDASAMNA